MQYVRKRKMVFSCCVEKDSPDAIINPLAFQLSDEGINDKGRIVDFNGVENINTIGSFR